MSVQESQSVESSSSIAQNNATCYEEMFNFATQNTVASDGFDRIMNKMNSDDVEYLRSNLISNVKDTVRYTDIQSRFYALCKFVDVVYGDLQKARNDKLMNEILEIMTQVAKSKSTPEFEFTADVENKLREQVKQEMITYSDNTATEFDDVEYKSVLQLLEMNVITQDELDKYNMTQCDNVTTRFVKKIKTLYPTISSDMFEHIVSEMKRQMF